MSEPLLGWISPAQRTDAQHAAHARALAMMPRRFEVIGHVEPEGPVKVMLTDFWKSSAVIADLGFPFTGFFQYTGSCFPGGTPVRLSNGSEMAIESIQVGDEVVTHTGQNRKVVDTMTRLYDGELVMLHVSGFPFPLEMTADHPVAVMDDGFRWKQASDLEENDKVLIGWGRSENDPVLDMVKILGSDRVIDFDELMKENAYTRGNEPQVPIGNVGVARDVVKRSGIDWKGRIKLVRGLTENAILRHVPVSPSLGRLIGLYLAEGGTDAWRIVFTFHAKETALAGEVLALVRGLFGVEGELVRQRERKTVLKVRFNNQTLAEVFKALVPGNVYTKRIPGVFFTAGIETRLALLLGWMAGDGYVGIKGGKQPSNVRITGVTTCAGLARDMTTLALSCGLRATAGQRKARRRSKVSYGVDLSGKKAVSLFAAVAHRADGERYTIADNARTPFGYARRIRRIEKRAVEGFRVFDFEVEEDHSFIANGMVVHNCVGVSTGDAVFTVGAVQRNIATNPTKAFIPWWPFDYGTCRHNEGDRGQGEGAVDSVMAQTLIQNGVMDAATPGLPQFTQNDGFRLSSQVEMQYSDGAASINTQFQSLAKQHVLGSAAPLSSVADIRSAIINGYPVLDGCDNYIGHGALQGSGSDAVAIGQYDGNGGHSTCYLGVWDHPSLGTLYLYSNQWAGSTYPDDGSGKGRCCVWVKEVTVEKLFSTGGSGGETIALSHLSWFPAQPNVLNWII